jgi:hypothetical protein
VSDLHFRWHLVLGNVTPEELEGANWNAVGLESGFGCHLERSVQEPHVLVISLVVRTIQQRDEPQILWLSVIVLGATDLVCVPIACPFAAERQRGMTGERVLLDFGWVVEHLAPLFVYVKRQRGLHRVQCTNLISCDFANHCPPAELRKCLVVVCVDDRTHFGIARWCTATREDDLPARLPEIRFGFEKQICAIFPACVKFVLLRLD